MHVNMLINARESAVGADRDDAVEEIVHTVQLLFQAFSNRYDAVQVSRE